MANQTYRANGSSAKAGQEVIKSGAGDALLETGGRDVGSVGDGGNWGQEENKHGAS